VTFVKGQGHSRSEGQICFADNHSQSCRREWKIKMQLTQFSKQYLV